MNHERSKAALPAITKKPPGYDCEHMKLYHQTKRIYGALMVDDETDNRVKYLLETYAKHELNIVYPPMTVNYFQSSCEQSAEYKAAYR